MSPYIVPGLKFKEPKKLTPAIIVEIVCDVFDIDQVQLRKRCRKRELVVARYMCCFFIRKYTTKTLAYVAEMFNQDHTTVIHGITTINNLMDIKDPAILRLMFEIETAFEVITKKIHFEQPEEVAA